MEVNGRAHKHHKHKKKHHKKKGSKRHVHSRSSTDSDSDSSAGGAEPASHRRHQVRAHSSKRSMRSHNSESTVGSARPIGALDVEESFMETGMARRIGGSALAPVPDTGSPMPAPLDLDTTVLKKREVLRHPNEVSGWQHKAGKSGSTRKSLRSKGSRRDMMQGTKSSFRRLANSMRQVTNSNSVKPVSTTGSGKLVGGSRGCCGLRPLPILLCLLCLMAIVAAIVIVVVVASADSSDAPAFKKQGTPDHGLCRTREHVLPHAPR